MNNDNKMDWVISALLFMLIASLVFYGAIIYGVYKLITWMI